MFIDTKLYTVGFHTGIKWSWHCRILWFSVSWTWADRWHIGAKTLYLGRLELGIRPVPKYSLYPSYLSSVGDRVDLALILPNARDVQFDR